MLKRIISIENVGRFKDYQAKGNVELKQVTLIFGENARGKSTLCDILRSLSLDDPALIIGRQTLGQKDAPELRLLTSAGTIQFAAGKWSHKYPAILIFDGTYVKDNVFNGDEVGDHQQANFFNIAIGSLGEANMRALDLANSEIRAVYERLDALRDALHPHLPEGMDYDAFVRLSVRNIDPQRIAALEQKLSQTEKFIRLSREPLPVPIGKSVKLHLAPLVFNHLHSISDAASARVKSHCDRHGLRDLKWLSQGLDLLSGDSCPFCDQTLGEGRLIQDFKTHILTQPSTLDLELFLRDFDPHYVRTKIESNESRLLFWREHCTFAESAFKCDESDIAKFEIARHKVRSVLALKLADPFQVVSADSELKGALLQLDTFFEALNNYDKTITGSLEVMEHQQQLWLDSVDAAPHELRGDLQQAHLLRNRSDPRVESLCRAYSATVSELEEARIKRDETKRRLLRDSATAFAEYGSLVNHYLERINASFQISVPTPIDMRTRIIGDYQLLINHQRVELGVAQARSDVPSFKNTLSAGDRNTLALAFFLAQLEQDGNRKHRIVVFDDPFASLDAFRRNQTANEIVRCSETCDQVIVLSHDPAFLHILWERLPSNRRKALALNRDGKNGTAIVEWEIDKSRRGRFASDLDFLMNFLAKGEGTAREVIQKIRPVLETYCRTLYPTIISDKDNLGKIVSKVATLDPSHPLHRYVQELDELNHYCREHHHGDGSSIQGVEINETELLSYIKRALKLVGCLV